MPEQPEQQEPSADPQLVDYISRHLGRFSDEQIKARLVADEIPPKAVELAFKQARAKAALTAKRSLRHTDYMLVHIRVN